MKTLNIEHRTLNAERRTLPFCPLRVACCVFFALAALPLRAEQTTNAPIPAPTAAQAERVLDQSEVTMLLRQALQQEYVKDRGELELKLTQPWKDKKISDAPITVKITEMPTMGVVPSFIVRFELHTTNENLGSWQMPAQAHVWHDAWVAHSMLKRGDSLADADITRERRDMLLVHEPLAEFAEDRSALEIAEPVGINAPLLARCVRPMPVVHRGQTVQALVSDGALSIAMKVEVLEDGAPGQTVRVRNKQTLKDIRGKVLNEQTILVSL